MNTDLTMKTGGPLQAPLDQETAAKHNWVVDFVNFKAGPIPAELNFREGIRYQIAVIEKLLERSVATGETEANHTTYPQRDIFAPGLYARELTVPAGNLLIGKLHKYSVLNFLLRGKVSVLTEEGGWEILTAPCTLIAPAGVKRLGFVHEDMIWTVLHPTDLTDPREIEDAVIAKSYGEIGMTEPLMALEGPIVKELV